MFDKTALKILAFWISEREAIREKKEAGRPKPWTDDPWLRDYRWCNVCRMDDKVSRWLRAHWYTPRATLRVRVVAAVLARMFNWPETLFHISGGTALHEWHYQRDEVIRDRLEAYRARGNKVFTGAYIINGAQGGSKIAQVMRTVDLAWRAGDRLLDTNSMEVTWENFMRLPGVGSFIAGQIVADLRFTVKGKWEDRMVWAPIGPGSRRGMRRMLGLPAVGALTQAKFEYLLPPLWRAVMRQRTAAAVFEARSCEAMDLQNCLCEFDKYVRLRYEGGRVRNNYPGTT